VGDIGVWLPHPARIRIANTVIPRVARDIFSASFILDISSCSAAPDHRGASLGRTIAENSFGPVWTCQRSVDVDVAASFAWHYMADVRNWNDPPAEFTLDGPFAAGGRGTTSMPGRPPVYWTIATVDPGRAYTIQTALSDGASMRFIWQFE